MGGNYGGLGGLAGGNYARGYLAGEKQADDLKTSELNRRLAEEHWKLQAQQMQQEIQDKALQLRAKNEIANDTFSNTQESETPATNEQTAQLVQEAINTSKQTLSALVKDKVNQYNSTDNVENRKRIVENIKSQNLHKPLGVQNPKTLEVADVSDGTITKAYNYMEKYSKSPKWTNLTPKEKVERVKQMLASGDFVMADGYIVRAKDLGKALGVTPLVNNSNININNNTNPAGVVNNDNRATTPTLQTLPNAGGGGGGSYGGTPNTIRANNSNSSEHPLNDDAVELMNAVRGLTSNTTGTVDSNTSTVIDTNNSVIDTNSPSTSNDHSMSNDARGVETPKYKQTYLDLINSYDDNNSIFSEEGSKKKDYIEGYNNLHPANQSELDLFTALNKDPDIINKYYKFKTEGSSGDKDLLPLENDIKAIRKSMEEKYGANWNKKSIGEEKSKQIGNEYKEKIDALRLKYDRESLPNGTEIPLNKDQYLPSIAQVFGQTYDELIKAGYTPEQIKEEYQKAIWESGIDEYSNFNRVATIEYDREKPRKYSDDPVKPISDKEYKDFLKSFPVTITPNIPNIKKEFIPRIIKGKRGVTKGIVVHRTAGSTAQSAINEFKNGRRGVGVPYVIDKDGTIYWLAPDEAKTWHTKGGGNNTTVGIEVVGAPKGGKYEPMTKAQKQSLANLILHLSQKYNLNPNRDVVGHIVTDSRKGYNEGKEEVEQVKDLLSQRPNVDKAIKSDTGTFDADNPVFDYKDKIKLFNNKKVDTYFEPPTDWKREPQKRETVLANPYYKIEYANKRPMKFDIPLDKQNTLEEIVGKKMYDTTTPSKPLDMVTTTSNEQTQTSNDYSSSANGVTTYQQLVNNSELPRTTRLTLLAGYGDLRPTIQKELDFFSTLMPNATPQELLKFYADYKSKGSSGNRALSLVEKGMNGLRSFMAERYGSDWESKPELQEIYKKKLDELWTRTRGGGTTELSENSDVETIQNLQKLYNTYSAKDDIPTEVVNNALAEEARLKNDPTIKEYKKQALAKVEIAQEATRLANKIDEMAKAGTLNKNVIKEVGQMVSEYFNKGVLPTDWEKKVEATAGTNTELTMLIKRYLNSMSGQSYTTKEMQSYAEMLGDKFGQTPHIAIQRLRAFADSNARQAEYAIDILGKMGRGGSALYIKSILKSLPRVETNNHNGVNNNNNNNNPTNQEQKVYEPKTKVELKQLPDNSLVRLFGKLWIKRGNKLEEYKQ